MKIEVELVGFLSYNGLQTGFSGGEVELNNNSLVDDLLGKIGISALEPYLIVRDQKILTTDDKLFHGDLIQIIPPISGG